MLNLKRCRELFVRHLHFVGPGLVSSVAYIDPGNWATDLQAGADYGYKLLFVVLIAGLAAVVLQLLAVRLGTVTSRSLPSQTRSIFLRLIARYPKYRIPLKICLYFLYALAEIAIIGTDLAELLGSAIALNLLFPALPLWAGVLVTAADVLIVLMFFRSDSGRQGMLFFEIVIVSLVLAVFVSFMILLNLIQPEWKEVFFGLVPSHTLIEPGALYVGVGIIGATVMPHALFLGSSLASVDRLDMLPTPPEPTPRKTLKSYKMPALNLLSKFGLRKRQKSVTYNEDGTAIELNTIPKSTSRSRDLEADVGLGSAGPSRTLRSGGNKDEEGIDTEELERLDDRKESEFEVAQREYEADIRSFDRIAWVDTHVLHSTIDTSFSLLGFALTINASILTLAGAAYFYSTTGDGTDDASLAGAYSLIRGYIGQGAATIFALALLCAGQSASITATLAGQVVSEGFIEWKTSPFLRRLVTRLISVIPAAIVAAAAGQSGLNTMLVASQVLLSIVLPSVIFPLVYLCSKDEIMTVLGPEVDTPVTDTPQTAVDHTVPSTDVLITDSEVEIAPRVQGNQEFQSANEIRDETEVVSDIEAEGRKKKSYRSPKWVTALGYLMFAIIIVANCYVIVELGLGN